MFNFFKKTVNIFYHYDKDEDFEYFKYKPGEKVSLTAKEKDGYVFKGWYINYVLVSDKLTYEFDMPKHEIILNACFERIKENKDEEELQKRNTAKINKPAAKNKTSKSSKATTKSATKKASDSSTNKTSSNKADVKTEELSMKYETKNSYIVSNGSPVYDDFAKEIKSFKKNGFLGFVSENLFDSYDGNETYATNVRHIISEVKKYPKKFIKVLNYRTYTWLKCSLKNELILDGQKVNLLGNDFLVLHALDIIDSEVMNIKPKWREAIEKIISTFDVKDIKYIKNVTLLNGLLDIYGFIPNVTLMEIINKHYKNQFGTVTWNKILEMLNTSTILRINYTLVGNNLALINYLILGDRTEETINKFLKLYDEFDLDYKIYSYNDVMHFACAHTWSGLISDSPYEFHPHLFNSELSYFAYVYDDNDSSISNKAKQFNLNYPKWILKGHTMLEVSNND